MTRSEQFWIHMYWPQLSPCWELSRIIPCIKLAFEVKTLSFAVWYVLLKSAVPYNSVGNCVAFHHWYTCSFSLASNLSSRTCYRSLKSVHCFKFYCRYPVYALFSVSCFVEGNFDDRLSEAFEALDFPSKMHNQIGSLVQIFGAKSHLYILAICPQQ